MAINIFSGNSGSRRKVNTASNSTRAQAARAALVGPAEVSDSGSTAVRSGGSLAKIGNTVGKIAGLASKFLPGVAGTIAGGISNLLNDPEWWQSVPGDAITLNSPLRDVDLGTVNDGTPVVTRRYAMAEFVSAVDPSDVTVIKPSNMAVTQYLMPEIRKVVNAIPLQSAAAYNKVLTTNATIYAMWRQLKKFDYMLKHGQTYLASMNDPFFPLFQVENASYLQATINRLEEYLRANVRLPHTLCEYLAWRYGRVYRSNDSAKAGLILYNVLSISADIAAWNQAIAILMNTIAESTENQQANTDLFNAYYDHDMMVEIRDDTQFTYDCKEFMLRTNLAVLRPGVAPITHPTKNIVAVDSRLDNPTAFMASTVSTPGTDDVGGESWLFPVRLAGAYIPFEKVFEDDTHVERVSTTDNDSLKLIYGTKVGSHWARSLIYSVASTGEGVFDMTAFETFVMALLTCKSLDIYNKGIYLTTGDGSYIDCSAISIDSGVVEDRILGVEHVYAFANLVHIDRKTSMSYQKAEKLVARDTANLIEKLDVAAVTPTPAPAPSGK